MLDSSGQTSGLPGPIEGSSSDLERQVADRTRELSTLNAISEVISRSLDLQEILNDALDATLEVMGLDMGGIYLLDEQAQALNMVASRGFRPGADGRQ